MAKSSNPPQPEEPEDELESIAAIPFQQVLAALLDTEQPLQTRYLYRLSDLSQDELSELERAWPRIPEWRRQALMEDIDELGGTDFILSFEMISRFALRDENAQVRALAIRSLWDYELTDLIPVYFELMEMDSAPEVRSAAATGLGKFIFLGEIEELPEKIHHQIEDRLLKIANGQDVSEVRRRALEALGFSSREEVPPLIENAFYSGQTDWVASALFAMGRSANEVWVPLVLGMMEDDEPTLRMEAARAAGELEARRAVPRLVELLNDDDSEVRLSAVWSLSQIGGEGVREVLEQMYEDSEDDEETEFIEEALDNLAFTEELEDFALVDMDEEEGQDDIWMDELEDEGDDILEENFEDDEDLSD